VVVVAQPVWEQHRSTTRPLLEKAEAEHSIRFLELQFATQPVVVQELKLAIRLVLQVIAAAPLHRMVAPEQLVQSRPLHQLRILALVVEARVGQTVLIWSAETALAELLLFNTHLIQLHLPSTRLQHSLLQRTLQLPQLLQLSESRNLQQ
jgi:hypothetical protein